jgi:hypothetical protein
LHSRTSATLLLPNATPRCRRTRSFCSSCRNTSARCLAGDRRRWTPANCNCCCPETPRVVGDGPARDSCTAMRQSAAAGERRDVDERRHDGDAAALGEALRAARNPSASLAALTRGRIAPRSTRKSKLSRMLRCTVGGRSAAALGQGRPCRPQTGAAGPPQ